MASSLNLLFRTVQSITSTSIRVSGSADGFRSLSASLKHGDLSQATVIGVFAPELATIGKDMVVYALDGRKGDGAHSEQGQSRKG